MLKRLVIVALAVFFLPIYGQEKTSQSNKNSNSTTQQHQPPYQPPTDGVTQVFCGSVTNNQQASGGKKDYSNYQTPNYLAPFISPDLLVQTGILLVGCCSVLVALFSALAVWRQANHIAASERAWLIASMDTPIVVNAGQWVYAGIPKLTNKGKTPAFIYEIGNAAEFLPKGEYLPSSPPPFPSKDIFKFDGRGVPVAPSGEVGRPMISDSIDVSEILSGKTILWVFGYVKYRDVFTNEKRETRYCFRLIPSLMPGAVPHNFVIDGTPAYNRAD